MTYHVITASYNCFKYLPRSLTSIDRQNYKDYKVCVVDDGSTDPDQAPFIKGFCEKRGWEHLLFDENRGALYSQVHAIRHLDPGPEDVIVYLDGDDRFARDDVFQILDCYYDDPEILLTYGNYKSDPPDENCPRPYHYPLDCVTTGDFRNAHRWGIAFNHLRTHKAKLFYELDETDFKDDNGNWFEVAGDTAMMIPCLELAGERHVVISEPLVLYTSDAPHADWKLYSDQIDRNHECIFRKPKKRRL